MMKGFFDNYVETNNLNMKKKILILGAGFGGLETATSLSENLGEDYEITLIDKNNSFFIGFSKFELMFGRKTEDQITYSYGNLKAHKVNFIQNTITRIDVESKSVVIADGHEFTYDYLVVALGAELKHAAIPGFVESGAHEFYSLSGAKNLYSTLSDFKQGRLVLTIFNKPYKCPPAPYEGAFQMHDFFLKKGVRADIQMQMIIPGPMPIPVSKAVSDSIESLLAEKGIELIKKTKITSINYIEKQAIAEDGAAFPYDLFIGVPIHTPPAVVRASQLGQQGFIPVSRENLETAFENVYAIGDVNKVPVGAGAVPKTGAFAEDAAVTVVSDILKKEGLINERRKFEATGACYLEFGEGKVARLNANFLGGEKPHVFLEGLSADLRPEKIHFETSRKERWFK